MKSELESFSQLQLFAFKLRSLYLKDHVLFLELSKLVPFSIFINKRENLDITFANHQLLSKGQEMEALIENGASYLPTISNKILMDHAKQKTKYFGLRDDKNEICTYFQQFTINGNPEFFYSNKLILNEHLYFNVSSFVEDFGMIGQIFRNIFEPFKNQENILLKFLSLTQQEKKIIKLISEDYSSAQISEILYISKNTVRTHIRNIYKKTDTNKTSQLIRIGFLLNLI